MLTRQGIAVLTAGVAALVIGRIFGIIELFVIGAACFAAVAAALVHVRLRRPRIEAVRWVHPTILVAGDTGRVDLHLHHQGTFRSTPFTLEETVRRTMTDDHVARLPVPALGADARSSSGYRLPTATRGVIDLGPLCAVLRDPLGIATSSTTIVGTDTVIVAPRAHNLDMPRLGQGALGAALLESAKRLGPGDFHGLREYEIGDEPRSIHWKASARTDALMVKEHTVEGLHQCTVVFDPAPGVHGSNENFERAVTASASLVHSAVRAGLTTRFVTADGIDLRGPEVVANTLRVLARIEPTETPIVAFDAELTDGLGLLVVVTGSRHAASWRAAQAVHDPATTRLIVTTNDRIASRLTVAARSDEEFLASWQSLVGRDRVDLLESVIR